MNKVIPWLKSNWFIVVMSVLILAILPTALIISSGMNAKLRDQVQKRVQEDERELGAATISYTITSPIPGVPDVEHRAVANRATIDWFKSKREAIQGEAVQVWNAALAINRREHAPLMDGLFPAPSATADDRVLRSDFIRRFVEQVPGMLLRTMNAGPPLDAHRLSEELMEHGTRRHDQILAQLGGTSLPREAGERLQRELVEMRLGRYRARAEEISVYADAGSFPDIFPEIPRNALSLEFCWEAQEAVWALQDFAAAVAAANQSIPGRPTGVPGSVVKRVIRVKVNEPPAPRDTSASDDPFAPRPMASPGGLVPTNPAASITGRVSGAGTENSLYDVRLIEADVIVSTRHLPVFINALGATNFMTVIDLDLQHVEPLEDLNQGYFYGDGEHVVRAKMVIETLWLREWTAPLMPKNVRGPRGIEDPAGSQMDQFPGDE